MNFNKNWLNSYRWPNCHPAIWHSTWVLGQIILHVQFNFCKHFVEPILQLLKYRLFELWLLNDFLWKDLKEMISVYERSIFNKMRSTWDIWPQLSDWGSFQNKIVLSLEWFTMVTVTIWNIFRDTNSTLISNKMQLFIFIQCYDAFLQIKFRIKKKWKKRWDIGLWVDWTITMNQNDFISYFINAIELYVCLMALF